MAKMQMKTKKIKILVVALLILFSICSVLAVLSLNTTSYMMQLDPPTKIIVYYNGYSNNQVFTSTSDEYHTIFNSIKSAHKQNSFKALFKLDLIKDVKVNHCEQNTINFSGIKVEFEYSSPQPLKCKNSIYTKSYESFWYQYLVFDINNYNDFNYNFVAIVPPISSLDFINRQTYTMYYQSYSNLAKTYNYLDNLK